MAVSPFALKPQDAIAYLKARGHEFPETFDWRDMWQEAHATAFTVAKSTGYNILGDIHGACLEVLEKGLPFREFSRNLTPVLQKKGWWGKKEMTDPVTGEKKQVQLGSPRRLKTIYHVNLRTAQAAGEWSRIQRFKAHSPFLRYVTMDDGRVRAAHQPFHNLVLPVDSVFWETHYTPNGWLCRCYVMQLAADDLAEFGLTQSPEPQVTYVPWLNKRTGEEIYTPSGVHPAFAYNPGKAALDRHAARALMGGLEHLPPAIAAAAMADSARFVMPALRDDTRAFVQEAAQAVQAGDLHARNTARVVGALREEQLAYLEQLGQAPQSGAVVVSQRDILHMQRPGKHNPWTPEELARLPEILRNPAAILWSKQAGGFVYVDASSADTARVVIVKTDTGSKIGRNKVTNNHARTTGRYSWEDLRNTGLYDVVWGKLPSR